MRLYWYDERCVGVFDEKFVIEPIRVKRKKEWYITIHKTYARNHLCVKKKYMRIGYLRFFRTKKEAKTDLQNYIKEKFKGE